MKLFIFFVIVVINVVNAYTIISNTGGISCDGTMCPANSATCVISRKTRPDLTKIDYVRKCLDSQGNVLDKFESTVNNPHPGSSMNTYISSGGGGYSNVISGRGEFGDNFEYSDEETRKHVEAAQKQAEAAIRHAKEQQEYWQRWSKKFSDDLQEQLKHSLNF